METLVWRWYRDIALPFVANFFHFVDTPIFAPLVEHLTRFLMAEGALGVEGKRSIL